MKKLSDTLRKHLHQQLAEFVQQPVEDLRPFSSRIDAELRVGKYRFAIEYKGRADSATIAGAIMQMHSWQEELKERQIPLLVVPFMTSAGSRLCSQYSVQWMDLAGNASIRQPGLIIKVIGQGKPPLSRGRPRSPFAHQASAVAHYLLLNIHKPSTQREIARATGLNEGYVSRIIQALEEFGFIRKDSGRINVADPEILLTAWMEQSSFPQQKVIRGIIPSRSGPETMEILKTTFEKAGQRFAFTGLPAAWQLDGFADFRLTTVYLEGAIPDKALGEIGFLSAEKGANVWLIPDAEESLFYGMQLDQGIPVVSPIRTYVDLKHHPERARDAAKHLLENVIRKQWNGRP